MSDIFDPPVPFDPGVPRTTRGGETGPWDPGTPDAAYQLEAKLRGVTDKLARVTFAETLHAALVHGPAELLAGLEAARGELDAVIADVLRLAR